jgi:CHAT domain-containing protein/predicted negative regulator of RcsB-dependent stress response
MALRTGYRLSLGLMVLCTALGRAAWGGELEAGKAAASRRDYPAAIAHWSRVVDAREGLTGVEALIRRAEAYRALGHYRDAEADLARALTAARQADQGLLEAVATQALGQVRFRQRDFAGAERLLRSARGQAERMERPGLGAAAANGLGNVQFEQGHRRQAAATYEQALALAQRAGDPGLEAAVRRNLARTAADPGPALEQLQAARTAALGLEDPYERAELLLGIGLQARPSVPGDAGLALAEDTLRQASILAQALGAPRLGSLAAGHLGRLQEDQGRLSQARGLTGQAIRLAQAPVAHELLVEWEWQLGRLLRAQGERSRAIEAYRRALYHLRAIRQDIPIAYHDGRSSFRETWAPIHLGLMDLLLQEAPAVEDPEVAQDLLREARDAIERTKVSELQDYLKDPCVLARTEEVESLSPTTAVLYPIIFPDRLELLVSVGGRLHQSTKPVSALDLLDTVALLANELRDNRAHRLEAEELYHWLIGPLLPLLERHNVDTLVFVPDGALRLVPLAALWDGERYLIERFAVVTAPGLRLLDPRPLPREGMTALLAGLSRAGPVVEQLPGPLRQGLAQATGAQTRGWRGIPVPEAELRETDSEGRRRELASADVIRALALPGVTEEITQLSEQMPGTVLLDQDFLRSRFSEQVQTHPFGVVHIASHGFFGGTPDENFVLTYDEKLDMDRLAHLLQPKQLADRPVELLTLSACQTAEGDDRTPLGLSGVAVKSGARSALGSLWPVYDDAAQQVIREFYRQLRDPGVTKAEALRRAQVQLIGSDSYRHPIFWAPFILIGNWL